MLIEGKFMDDARFKLIVDILIGRTSVGIPAAKARAAAARIAKRAVVEMIRWDDQAWNEMKREASAK